MIIYESVIKTLDEYLNVKKSYDKILFLLSECDHCEKLLSKINDNKDVLVVYIDNKIDQDFLQYMVLHNIKLPQLVINDKELDLSEDLIVLYINNSGD